MDMYGRPLRSRGHWTLIAAIAAGFALAAIGWATGLVGGGAPDPEELAPIQMPQELGVEAPQDGVGDTHAAAVGPPPAAAIEDCNRYAADTKRDAGRVVADALVGGAIGAGVGAASGGIADGHDGAGKGAGIGALVGATAGTLHGLSQENSRTEAARAAYRDCMAGRGYTG